MVPATAIERLRRLQDQAAEARASYLSTHEAVTDLRDQLGRAELSLHRHSPGRRLRVEPDGQVVVVGLRPPPRDLGGDNIEILPPATTPFAASAAVQREAAEIVRLRERLARLQARGAELSARAAVFGELARAAEELLNDRGWTDAAGEVSGLIGPVTTKLCKMANHPRVSGMVCQRLTF